MKDYNKLCKDLEKESKLGYLKSTSLTERCLVDISFSLEWIAKTLTILTSCFIVYVIVFFSHLFK